MRSTLLVSVFCCLFVITGFSQKTCVTHEYSPELMKNVAASPEAARHTGSQPRSLTTVTGSSGSPDELIIIPVIVHILYKTSDQNISAEQVKSQIEALNNDFRRKNTDTVNTPAMFKGLAADTRIEFRLATTDPAGMPTSGIIRKQTFIDLFGLDDRIKSSQNGGDDPWDRDQYLNIWIGNLAGGIVGYSSLPGAASEKDGVVIRCNAFGTKGSVIAPFDRGRTSTHEIGHWLGLRHIWGDNSCGDDRVEDTPPQQGPSRGCPSGVVVSCNNGPSGNMYMNFMDFTNDQCTNMFTGGQAGKMRQLFNENGLRYAMLSSNGASGLPVEDSTDLTPSSAGEMMLYPNPAVSQLTVRFNNAEDLGGRSIIIYNQLGQLVRQIRISGKIMQINVSGLQEGVYFISSGIAGRTLKFIKIK